ncbi:RILP-like protein 2 isoform X2 [Heterocephalus glaber]|uniref:RILP-like protein 2 n=1 Tax=Heterocephalus glaber TaxID=10181 RepID=A0AAX6SZN0_HETGA|nr:RILP-like protein 2 isoform X2 [Heterocephalus glaber]
MEEPRVREEEEDEDEEEDGEDEAGPEGALGKSALQLTAEDVYDISYVVGRELMALGSDPRVTQLQFKIVRVLELLEALVDLGPDKMVVDLTDPNRPRFTLQELKEVLQERNALKAQLLLAQEELRCYQSGLIPPREGPGGRQEKEAAVPRPRSADHRKGERTIMKKLPRCPGRLGQGCKAASRRPGVEGTCVGQGHLPPRPPTLGSTMRRMSCTQGQPCSQLGAVKGKTKDKKIWY